MVLANRLTCLRRNRFPSVALFDRKIAALIARLQLAIQPQGTASLLTLDIDRAGNVVVVRCRGRLVAGVNDILYTGVHRLIPDAKRIVLDLTDLTHMDSMGLGTVVHLFVSAKSAGCDLELINLGKQIRSFLRLPISCRCLPLSANIALR